MYVGDDIGAEEGELDDYKGYREMERMEAVGGGRHVMGIGGRLIDGLQGYTWAQYINSAYRAQGWCNKAEMLDGGTIRVMSGRVIHAGEEILMAYHTEYWERWAPRERKRGRSAMAAAPAVSSADAEVDGDERGGDAESPGVGELGEDGAWWWVRAPSTRACI